MMRLDKFISSATNLSRAQARKALRAGTVTVNGVRGDPSQPVRLGDRVSLNDEIISLPRPRYFMLYKPQGYVCATSDGEHPTVLDLVDQAHKAQLQIAGRLDIDTTGLVLVTDDGQWNHRITSPRRHCKKLYRVSLAKPLANNAGRALAEGIWLRGDEKPTLPASLQILSEREVFLTIQEGRYHQVKRMFAALGNRVVALHRQAIGAIVLDPQLQPGHYRPLTGEEIACV